MTVTIRVLVRCPFSIGTVARTASVLSAVPSNEAYRRRDRTQMRRRAAVVVIAPCRAAYKARPDVRPAHDARGAHGPGLSAVLHLDTSRSCGCPAARERCNAARSSSVAFITGMHRSRYGTCAWLASHRVRPPGCATAGALRVASPSKGDRLLSRGVCGCRCTAAARLATWPCGGDGLSRPGCPEMG